MSRTIVVSDLHGNAGLLERALAHSGFGSGDSLVVAGDLVDVGRDDMIALAEQAGATILAGNHEVAGAIGLQITPQNPDTLARGPELARRLASGEWPLALAVDGWLITHAGISIVLDDIAIRAGHDPAGIAESLNEMFRTEIASAVRRMPVAWEDLANFRLIGGDMGPLWFRPLNLHHLPSGLRQIVGHTPPEMLSDAHRAALESRGWLLVEPGDRGLAGTPCRYAVIENGGARVEECSA